MTAFLTVYDKSGFQEGTLTPATSEDGSSLTGLRSHVIEGYITPPAPNSSQPKVIKVDGRIQRSSESRIASFFRKLFNSLFGWFSKKEIPQQAAQPQPSVKVETPVVAIPPSPLSSEVTPSSSPLKESRPFTQKQETMLKEVISDATFDKLTEEENPRQALEDQLDEGLSYIEVYLGEYSGDNHARFSDPAEREALKQQLLRLIDKTYSPRVQGMLKLIIERDLDETRTMLRPFKAEGLMAALTYRMKNSIMNEYDRALQS